MQRRDTPHAFLGKLTRQNVEAFFQALLEESSDVYLVLEPPVGGVDEPRALLANGAFRTLTGQAPQAVRGRELQALIDAQAHPALRGELGAAVAAGRRWSASRVLGRARDGSRFWIDLTVTPLALGDGTDGAGEGPGALHLLRAVDVTGAVRTAALLRDQQSSLDYLLSCARMGYWDLDYRSGLSKRSLEHDRIFGYSEPVPDHVWTRDYYMQHVHPQDLPRVSATYEAARRTGETFQHEYRVQGVDGRMRWVWASGRFLLDDEGRAYRCMGTCADITERKEQDLRAQHLALTDALTGLPNRRMFSEALDRAVATSPRRHEYAALLFADLDDFKRINDTLGHDVGDRLLARLANALHYALQGITLLARFGGDEFIILAEGLGREPAAARAAARTLCGKISQVFSSPARIDGQDLTVTASIGVSVFRGTSTTAVDVLKQADIAMYQAKGAGKDTARFFDSSMEQHMLWRSATERGLRQALLAQQFFLVYQPQVDARGKLLGFEALLRWQHPERGVVEPAEFIALAEETGLIRPIGAWVLNEACRTLSRWARDPRLAGLSLSLNLSAVQFGSPGFVDEVATALAAAGVPGSRLVLEITEHTLMKDLDGSARKIRELMSRGVHFSLDDFGTGYSSLYYLKTLPLKEIKIDRSFTRDVLTDTNDEAIVAAIVSIADKLDLTVIAEGVETAEQFERLQELRCHAYQGYYFSRPMAAADTFGYGLPVQPPPAPELVRGA